MDDYYMKKIPFITVPSREHFENSRTLKIFAVSPFYRITVKKKSRTFEVDFF